MDSPPELSFSRSILGAVASALQDDPFYVAIVASRDDPAEKMEILMKYLDYSFLEGCRIGRTIVAEAGASIWTLPVLDEDVAAAERISKQTYMEQLLGDDYSTYVKLIAFMSSRADCADFHTAWYLSILGVHPEHQKQGIGSRLLTSTLQEADSARVMCYLETFDDNKGFYEKFGFKSTFSHFIPEINAAYTIMTRDPV